MFSDIDRRASRTNFNRCEALDTHELLKLEMEKQKNDQEYLGIDKTVQLKQSQSAQSQKNTQIVQTVNIPNLSIGIYDSNIYFDSIYKLEDSHLNSGTFSYNIYKVNNGKDIDNCVSIRISDLYISRPLSLPSGSIDPFYFKRVYLELTNLPLTQGVLTGIKRYHFEFEVQIIDNYRIKLTPINDTIYFSNPVTTISNIIAKFSVPPLLTGINFPQDIYIANIIPLTSTIQIYGSSTSIFGVAPGPTIPQIEMYFVVAPSNDGKLSNTGYYITNLSNSGSICTATLSSPPFSQTTNSTQNTCTILICRNRVAFAIRFTSIKNNITNYTLNMHT